MTTPSDEIRSRLSRVIAGLGQLARGCGPIADWREAWLDVTLAVHELEAVLAVIRRQIP
jgi:hypothetical protein